MKIWCVAVCFFPITPARMLFWDPTGEKPHFFVQPSRLVSLCLKGSYPACRLERAVSWTVKTLLGRFV